MAEAAAVAAEPGPAKAAAKGDSPKGAKREIFHMKSYPILFGTEAVFKTNPHAVSVKSLKKDPNTKSRNEIQRPVKGNNSPTSSGHKSPGHHGGHGSLIGKELAINTSLKTCTSLTKLHREKSQKSLPKAGAPPGNFPPESDANNVAKTTEEKK